MQQYPFVGFRQNCVVSSGEYRTSPTCRYVKLGNPDETEEQRVCGNAGVLGLPVCDEHCEKYLHQCQIYKSAFGNRDITRPPFLQDDEVAPRSFPLVRSFGVNLEVAEPVTSESILLPGAGAFYNTFREGCSVETFSVALPRDAPLSDAFLTPVGTSAAHNYPSLPLPRDAPLSDAFLTPVGTSARVCRCCRWTDGFEAGQE
jgi:hypothetical protein